MPDATGPAEPITNDPVDPVEAPATGGVDPRPEPIADAGTEADPGSKAPARLDPKRLAVVAVLGGLVISLGDHLFHVRTGVVVHHVKPLIDGQSIWVIPQFIVAAAVMVAVAQPAARRLPRPPIGRVVLAVVLFYAAYWITGQLGVDHPWVTLEILFATFALRLAFEHPPSRLPVLAVGVVIGLGGCVGEALNSNAGFFDYTYENVVVPFWLFPLYLHGGAAVVGIASYARGPARPKVGPAQK